MTDDAMNEKWEALPGKCSKTGIKYSDAIAELQAIVAECDRYGTRAKMPLPVRVRVLIDAVIEAALSPSPVTPDASGLLPEEIWLNSISVHGGVYCSLTQINEADAKYTRASSSLAELEAENRKLRKQIELHKVAVDKWVPCPDCRDKTREACYVCENQTLTNRNKALRAKLDKRTKALERCFAVLIAQDFEQDEGSPPILKDGVKDTAINAAREALTDKEESENG